MDNTKELYHYGIPGMRWGKRRTKQDYNISSKNKYNTNTKNTKITKSRQKLSTGKKIAIGSAAVGVGLLSIGAMLRTEVAQKRYSAFVLGKSIVNAM